MPDRSNSDQYPAWIGLIYIFNIIVGTGALTLPKVFAQAGWALGTTVVLILAFVSFMTVTFVVESMSSANAIIAWQKIQQKKRAASVQEDGSETEAEGSEIVSQARPSTSDTEDTPLVPTTTPTSNDDIEIPSRYYTISEKIELGEMASIFFNNFGTTLFYVCLSIYLYGDLSIYGASIASSLMDVACTYVPPNSTCNDTISDHELCWGSFEIIRIDAYRIFLSLFIFFIGPFAFFNVQKTKYLQLLTSAMRWLAFSMMIIYAMKKIITSGAQGHPPAANFDGTPGLFGACVYSFMCHHSLPSLVSPISNKSKFTKLLSLDYSLIALFYLLLAFTGSFAFKHLDDLYTLDFGPHASGDCSKPDGNFFVLIIQYFLALFIVFTLGTSFPIIAITLRNNLQSLFLRNDRRYNFFLRRIIFPLLAISPPYFIAMAVKDISKLVEFTGSFAGAGIQYVIPTVLVFSARRRTRLAFGSGVVNEFASPFQSAFWLFMVIFWAAACVVLVSLNLAKVPL